MIQYSPLLSSISLILQLGSLFLSRAQEFDITTRNLGDPMVEWFDTSEQIYGDGTYYGSASHIFMPPEYEGKVDARVALNNPQHRMGAYGMCIKVKGSGKGQGGQGSTPITTERLVYVADVCPECAWGDIDFAIASDGRWEIDWHAVECPVGDNTLKYIFKGSHEYYLKILPQVFKCPISKLEIFHHNNWISGEIANDNTRSYVFQALESHTYSFPMTVRLTSIFGEEIIDEIPYIADESTVIPGTRKVQFERCSFNNHHHIENSGTTQPTSSPFPTPSPTKRPTAYRFPSPSPTRQISIQTYSPTKQSINHDEYTPAPSAQQQTPYPTHKKPIYTMEPTLSSSSLFTKSPTLELSFTDDDSDDSGTASAPSIQQQTPYPTHKKPIYTMEPTLSSTPTKESSIFTSSPSKMASSTTPYPTIPHSDDEDEHSSADIYESLSS